MKIFKLLVKLFSETTKRRGFLSNPSCLTVVETKETLVGFEMTSSYNVTTTSRQAHSVKVLAFLFLKKQTNI